MISKSARQRRAGAQEREPREMMSAGFAWKARRRWFFRAVGTPCASTASMTGQLSQPRNHFSSAGSGIWKRPLKCEAWISRNVRSQSCPYCRGSLKRVGSMDLWVLTASSEVVDPETLAMDSLRRFYLYIESLPTLTHDTHVLLLDYMI